MSPGSFGALILVLCATGALSQNGWDTTNYPNPFAGTDGSVQCHVPPGLQTHARIVLNFFPFSELGADMIGICDPDQLLSHPSNTVPVTTLGVLISELWGVRNVKILWDTQSLWL
jgi:hypothetical protein